MTLLVEILDAGNLSLAARKLKMSRANVSYHLHQLEKSVGVQLVRRTTRRVEPTEVGLRLYEHGRSIMNEMLAARETIATLGQSLQGRVGLSMPLGYGQMVMAGWLIEFKRLYPGIVLEVMFENRVSDLVREDVDIAIRIMTEPPPALVSRALGPVRYVVCAARAYAQEHGLPTRLEHLATVPLFTSGFIGRELRVAAYRPDGQREEVLPRPTLLSEHFPFLRDAVLAGLGVGLLPDYVVADPVREGRIVTALDDYRLSVFGTQMFLLYMPNRYQTSSVRTLIDFILERAGGVPTRSPAPGRP
nr:MULTISPECIES: LysR family transcriptional regulator [unclassified Acidovorax]